jgi:beta-aspartyl-dipeptidase (metallo-type)
MQFVGSYKLMAFFKLLTGGHLFAPDDLGQQNVLVAGSQIAAIGKDLDISGGVDVDRISVSGKKITPGFIDLHVHITGGGGEAGPASRLPEIKVSGILSAGVTTVLGVLGTDSVSRSTETLLAKALGLEQEGITAYILSGAYTFPQLPTLTGSLQKDIALIPPIIGVGELAMSDHRGPHATFEEFIRVISDARVGGLIGGKPGLAVLHMGGGDERMNMLFRLVGETEIPIGQILPTHTTRNEALFDEAVTFARLGGNIDITARADDTDKELSLVSAIDKLQENDISLDQVTVSSDANGSLPVFDKNNTLIGMKMAESHSLIAEFQRLIFSGCLSPSKALKLFTSNAAARLGQKGKKGEITTSSSADLLVFSDNWNIDSVMAKGQIYLQEGKLIRGGFLQETTEP